MKTALWAIGAAIVGGAGPAHAGSPQAPPANETTHSIAATVEAEEFSRGRGSVRSLRFDYKFGDGDTTVLVSPTIGEQDSPGSDEAAFGVGGSIYHHWTQRISTRTHLFVSEDSPVFARIDAAQDITAKVADKTTLTAGIRWAEYFGDEEATFLSLGARRYFTGGSLAYRLTWTNPDAQDDFFAHLVNLTLNDGKGRGKTQIWAGTGETSLTRAQIDADFSGDDRAFLIQRTQPLSENFALVAAAGLSSYADPGGRYTGVNLGVGLTVDLDSGPPIFGF